MSSEHQSSYRQILKATSIFGGVQFINILIAIIRSKFIAVLLGPIGIGISSMFTATLNIIGGLTNFGIGTSAVRDISIAFESGNNTKFAIKSKVVQRWVWLTGILGLMVTMILSPMLSYFSFGNYNYTLSFVFLSISLLIGQLNTGQLVILQGSRKLKFLAKANLIGNIIGLFTTIPIYYWLGINGVVPALIISSLVALIISFFYRQKINIERIKVSGIRTIAEGKLMLKIGFLVSLSGFITLGSSYLVSLFIRASGGLKDLGFYNAGFIMINTYIGIVFAAMGTEYYPRLSAVANNLLELKNNINRQADVAIMLLGPIVVSFIFFIKWIIIILYSDQFILINEMMIWAVFGVLFKASSWSIAFVFLARGESKLFFYNELLANVYVLILNLAGYKWFGLTGLGISFLLGYLVYFIQVFIITKIKYGFELSKEFWNNLIIQLGLAAISIMNFYLFKNITNMILGFFIVLISIIISLYKLEKRIGLKHYLQVRANR